MFAISATAVDEIRAMDGLQQIGATGNSAIQKVRYRLVRDGRPYYVVDANLYFHMLPSHSTRVLVLRDTKVAVLVSHIDRMMEVGNVLSLPHAFCGEERSWFRGLAVLNVGSQDPVVVPVVKPESFLKAAELNLLEADEPRRKAKSAAKA